MMLKIGLIMVMFVMGVYPPCTLAKQDKTSTSVKFPPFNMCKQCRQQKITLLMHCFANKSLLRTEYNWCIKMQLLAKMLRDDHEFCDKLSNKHQIFSLRYPHKKLPFDSCDACFHNINALAMQCTMQKIKPASDCKRINRCADVFSIIYQLHPHALAETVESYDKLDSHEKNKP